MIYSNGGASNLCIKPGFNPPIAYDSTVCCKNQANCINSTTLFYAILNTRVGHYEHACGFIQHGPNQRWARNGTKRKNAFPFRNDFPVWVPVPFVPDRIFDFRSRSGTIFQLWFPFLSFRIAKLPNCMIFD